jgi:hypothetical protein
VNNIQHFSQIHIKHPLKKGTIGCVCDAKGDAAGTLNVEYKSRHSISFDRVWSTYLPWDIIPMRSLSETQFWFVAAGIAFTPMFIFGIADGIGWFLRRMLWRRPEITSQSEGAQARDQPEPEAPPR